MTPNLPEIQITRKLRATRLRLRVEPTQIKLTVPQFCTQRQVQEFLKQSEQWLIKTWQSQQEKVQKIDRTLPTELQLFNLNLPVLIYYQSQIHIFLFESDKLQQYVSDLQAKQYLNAFVIRYAKFQLPQELNFVRQQCNLPFLK